MKRIILLLLALGMIFVFAGCSTCPKQDTVEMMWTPFGPMTVYTEKDSYSEERHGEEQFMKGNGWLTLEEYEDLIKKYQQKQADPEEGETDKGI